MMPVNKGDRPARYKIYVKNHLDFQWEDWFEGMTITHINDGVTILSGDVIDQSALHGVLERIRNLNLILISVQLIDVDEQSKLNFIGEGEKGSCRQT